MIKVIELSNDFSDWLIPQGEPEFDEYKNAVENKIENEFPEAVQDYTSVSNAYSDNPDCFQAEEEVTKCLERIAGIFQDIYDEMRIKVQVQMAWETVEDWDGR